MGSGGVLTVDAAIDFWMSDGTTLRSVAELEREMDRLIPPYTAPVEALLRHVLEATQTAPDDAGYFVHANAHVFADVQRDYLSSSQAFYDTPNLVRRLWAAQARFPVQARETPTLPPPRPAPTLCYLRSVGPCLRTMAALSDPTGKGGAVSRERRSTIGLAMTSSAHGSSSSGKCIASH